MTMTDPIADMLSRVRNASNAHHDTVSMPSSKIKANIAEILKQEGYIANYTVEEENRCTSGRNHPRIWLPAALTAERDQKPKTYAVFWFRFHISSPPKCRIEPKSTKAQGLLA